MPRIRAESLLFIGIQGHALAVDRATGTEVWRRKLKGSDVVLIHRDAERLYATTKGEAWCLDPLSGAVLWNNQLKGLGLGLVCVATDVGNERAATPYTTTAEQQRRREAQSASAAAAAG
ncbi:MAG: PQQ-like beta-propeller repeat protein [Gemmatimonadota bacterium]|nr:PQQ-like beta-propeller repeat protein [Gemmatimonadota bacterium]